MTPEGKVKKEIDKYLASLGSDWWGFKPMMMGYGRNGIPDKVGCYKGDFVAIEAKVEGEDPKPWQDKEHAAIRLARGHIIIAYSGNDVKKYFEEYL